MSTGAEPVASTEPPLADHVRLVQVVALIGEGGQFGGPASVAVGLTRELADRGRDVTLIALSLGAVPRPEGIPADAWQLAPARRFVPMTGMLGLFNLRLLGRLWRTLGPGAVLHTHAGRDLVTVAALGIAFLRGAPVVAQTHGMVRPRASISTRLFDRVLVPLLGRASALLYLTESERADLRAVVGPAPSLRCVANGLATPAVARREPGVPRVVFASRLHPVKGVLAFAGAARLLLTAGTVADFIAYGPDQGDLEAFLERTGDPELDGRLRYGGALDHESTTKAIGAADVFVLPSRIDWMPMALLEALAAGVPTVSTSTCGLSPAIQAAGAGLVVDVVDDTQIDALARSVAGAVGRLLEDPDRARHMGSLGRELVQREFSITAVVDELETVYAAAAATPADAPGSAHPSGGDA